MSAQRVKDLILAECEGGATVFLTTHDMAAADELCDRVAFIVDGRIACIDSPRALKLQHGERVLDPHLPTLDCRFASRSGEQTITRWCPNNPPKPRLDLRMWFDELRIYRHNTVDRQLRSMRSPFSMLVSDVLKPNPIKTK